MPASLTALRSNAPTSVGSEGLAGPRPSICGRDLKDPTAGASKMPAIFASAARLDTCFWQSHRIDPGAADLVFPTIRLRLAKLTRASQRRRIERWALRNPNSTSVLCVRSSGDQNTGQQPGGL